MPDSDLVQLTSELNRLLHPRSSTPRNAALGLAYRLLATFAAAHNLTEEWCDRVLMIFLADQHAHVAA